MMRSVGSIWARWDLHVHTPASLVHNYPGDSTEAWTKFLDDLEDLPSEFKVLGINDYLFLDGYRRIRDERANGRLQNIELALPVVELRLKAFGGSESKLSRVNFHVIFADEIDPNVIESQFLNRLWAHYELSPAYEPLGKNWAGVATRESLEDLGKRIIESVPSDQRGKFGSPLIEGFNSLNFSPETITEALESPYFDGRFLTAVGKTEWANIKWNDQTIADKRQIVNSVDIVFTASDSPDNYLNAQAALNNASVNDRLLDCSDAHWLSCSADKDRIGNCFTWIKGDTTFLALKHALNEFRDRVYVGTEPEIRARVRSGGSRFIKSLQIKKKTDSDLDETWFDTEINLNPGLIAVIGNKGSGKSALAETLAILGNTTKEDFFSFLTPQKFRQAGHNRAHHFQGTLTWASGRKFTRLLSETVPAGAPEHVKFIPQNFLEKICTEVPHGAETDFDREIKRVIYSRLAGTELLGAGSLDELIEIKTAAIEQTISQLRYDVTEINKQIVEMEQQARQEYRQSLRNSLRSARDALRDLRRARPSNVSPPDASDELDLISNQIEAQRSARDLLTEQITQAEDQLGEVNKQISDLSSLLIRIELLDRQYRKFVEDNANHFESMGLDISAIVQLKFDHTPIEALEKQLSERKQALELSLAPENSDGLAAKREAVHEKLSELQGQLDAPHQHYEDYLSAINQWRGRRRAILGSAETPDTALFYRSRLRELLSLPERLEAKRAARRALSIAIHEKVLSLAEEYRELHKSIQQFIEERPENAEIQVTFNVAIVDTGFSEGFFEHVNRGVTGSFYGMSESKILLENLLAEHEFGVTDSIAKFADEVLRRLQSDYRVAPHPAMNVDSQLRKGRSVSTLYDWIFGLEYLSPRYAIKFRGKHLHELSPGEKGTLLLLFYLLVDKSDAPLIIDQPEDNVDNETVFRLLVRSVKQARNRRQIVLITHNPNLAVVCDADQVIVASMNKSGNSVKYKSGGIENPAINKFVLDILEGTRKAFDNRGGKYFADK